MPPCLVKFWAAEQQWSLPSYLHAFRWCWGEVERLNVCTLQSLQSLESLEVVGCGMV
jgi:hypothetical protein